VEVFISCRKEQFGANTFKLPCVHDSLSGEGPAIGILSAHLKNSEQAWLVLASDMPAVEAASVVFLTKNRNPKKAATVFVHPKTSILEPLFAIWEPSGLKRLYQDYTQGYVSPRLTLEALDCEVLSIENEDLLWNINTPEELEQFIKRGH
jgi:molybdopterin-guanine dinucleotide biosynthesis protein A